MMKLPEFLRLLEPVWRPHGGQRAFLEAEADTRVLACGRRWGKTVAVAADIVCSLHCRPPGRYLLVAPTANQVLIMFDRVVDFLERFRRLALKQTEKLKVRRSPFPTFEYNGCQVTARSGHRPHSLRGDEADYLVVDEAAFVSENLVEQTLMPMLATTAGKMTMLSTPYGYNHFYRWFMRGGMDGYWSQRAKSSDSPYVKESFLAEQKRFLPEQTYAVEYEAEFRDALGMVFTDALIERARRHPRPESPPGPFSIGIDWAETHDRTVVTVLSGTSEYAYVWEVVWFANLHFREQIKQILPLLSKYPNASIRCDSTGVGRSPTEDILTAVPQATVSQVKFNVQTKTDMITLLRDTVERDRLGIGDQPYLIGELRTLMSYPSPGGYVRFEAIRGHHDDAVMSLALALGGLTYGSPRIHVL